MTYSEDSATPAAPFSGDGSIFDHPDILLQAPTTNERVVDTQSGFLLVIKRMGERLALSCKRRVGTPPSSVILLTPDEGLKLSKILASSIVGLDDSAEENGNRSLAVGRRRFPFTPQTIPKKALGVLDAPKTFKLAAAIVGIAVLLCGSFVAGKFTSVAIAPAVENDPLAVKNVDKFARGFVSDMLDFNPDTYRISQVHAMSYMSPELLEKYWNETNFPLSRRQLKGLPQGTTVMITRIGQEKIDATTASADIYAQVVHSESKISSPVRIKLKLGVSQDNLIKVLEQEDLTAATR